MGGVGFRSSWIGWSAVFPKRRLAPARNWWDGTADHRSKRIFILVSLSGNSLDREPKLGITLVERLL